MSNVKSRIRRGGLHSTFRNLCSQALLRFSSHLSSSVNCTTWNWDPLGIDFLWSLDAITVNFPLPPLSNTVLSDRALLPKRRWFSSSSWATIRFTRRRDLEAYLLNWEFLWLEYLAQKWVLHPTIWHLFACYHTRWRWSTPLTTIWRIGNSFCQLRNPSSSALGRASLLTLLGTFASGPIVTLILLLSYIRNRFRFIVCREGGWSWIPW